MEFHSNSWKLEELQLNNNSMQDLHVSAIGRTEPTMKEEVERSQLGVKHEVANTVLQVENMMLEAKGRDSELDQRVRELIDELQDLVSFKKEYGSTVVTSINRRDSEIELVGPSLQRATHQYDYEHIVDNIPDPEQIHEHSLLSEWCIYKVPTTLLKVKEVSYTPRLISIGPMHHNKQELKEMQEQNHIYYYSFQARLVNKNNLMHYTTFLEQEEQHLRRCYQKKFSNISKEQFVHMMRLDAVFIMELILREAEREKHKNDYLVTQRCVSKSIQCDLMLLENQIPITVLEKLHEYDTVPSNVKKPTRFIELAHNYFISYYPL